MLLAPPQVLLTAPSAPGRPAASHAQHQVGVLLQFGMQEIELLASGYMDVDTGHTHMSDVTVTAHLTQTTLVADLSSCAAARTCVPPCMVC